MAFFNFGFNKGRSGTEEVKEEKGLFSGIIQSTFDGADFGGISKANSVTKNNGWVYGITNMIASNIAQVPLYLYVKTEMNEGKVANYKSMPVNKLDKNKLVKSMNFSHGTDVELIINHPAINLLKEVNSYQDGFQLMALTQMWLDVAGDAYWYILKDSGNVPVEIHCINPIYMKVVPNETNSGIRGYIYRNGTTVIAYDVDEIVRFSNGSLKSRYYGDSPLMALSSCIEKLEQIDKLEYSMLKNYGVPPLLLNYKGELTKNQIRELEIEWRRATTNKNAGGAKVVNGDITVTKIAQSISEMMFNEQIVMNLKQLALVYGVPYSMIDTSDQKRAGLDQILEMMAINCINPRIMKLQEAINQQYIPMFDNSGSLFFKFDDPSPDNRKNDAEINTMYVKSGILTKNEIRISLGYDAIEELDEKPEEEEEEEEPEEPEKEEDSKED